MIKKHLKYIIIAFILISNINFAFSEVTSKSVKQTWLQADKTIIINPQLNEISGLATTDRHFWGLNDSGDKAAIYAIDKNSLKLSKKVILRQADNFDWEEFAEDDKHLYIADTGDNFAIRQSITIYKIIKKDLEMLVTNNPKKVVSINNSALKIRYQNKENILPTKNHNFDSEAMTVVGDQIWLFSKNRNNRQSDLYLINKDKALQTITPIASYPVKGLITAADYNNKTQKLILLGYSSGGAFVWVLDVKNNLPDWSTAKNYRLKPYGQWEAIKWLTNKKFIIAAEKGKYSQQMMGYFTLP